MDKQRLLVMNGQRIVQSERGPNDWHVDKVEKAHGLKPGYYNLHTAQHVVKTGASEGPIVHADTASVYQQAKQGLVKHDTQDFGKVPEIGVAVSIKYMEGKAVVSQQVLKHGRSRGI